MEDEAGVFYLDTGAVVEGFERHSDCVVGLYCSSLGGDGELGFS